MTDDGGLVRSNDPDTSREAAEKSKARARQIAQHSIRAVFPSPLTARGLAVVAHTLFPGEVREVPGFISMETIRRRWHELPDPRLSPDGKPWGELVYQTHPDGSLVLNDNGLPVPARGVNPMGNSGRLMRWIPRSDGAS